MTVAERELLKAMGRFITEGLESIRQDYLQLEATRRELAVEARSQAAKEKLAEASANILDVKLYSTNPLVRHQA